MSRIEVHHITVKAQRVISIISLSLRPTVDVSREAGNN